MKTAIWIVIGSLITLGFLGGAYFILVSGQNPAPSLVNYSVTDNEKPTAFVASSVSDLGKMKVSDEKSAVFTIKNTGSKPLQLSNISSSCNCTFVKVIIDNKESDLFGMHNVSNFAGEIKPGEIGKIKVIYRPFVMPVYGEIEREAYITTNDPGNQKLIFKVKANVN